ncbi:hypothetical protein [Massilia luteola]|uniref:hypothetical protein n=1 Tax=Massilia luteola TaxID=3081751 RepID=UPI002ACC1B95|nr:hypothetical protein [Massilia sp. Gc5]
MREPIDTKTADLLPTCDLAGERRAKPTQREKTAARVAKMRERRGLKAITVNLPAELVEEFHTRRKARDQSANDAIAHLLRTQYLRKR